MHTVPPIYFTRRARDQAKIGDFTIKDQRTISDARAFKSCSLGQCAMFPEITTFSFKYVSYLAFSLAFGLKSAINYKSNIAELPANKNQNFSN